MLFSIVAYQFNYWSVESSLSGYLLDSLRFCSDKNQEYFVESHCPHLCVQRSNPFWNAISMRFSQKASGVATVVLNGTRTQGALLPYGTFFNHQLPALSANSVSVVRVILLHIPGQLRHETCKSPKSLRVLKKILEDKQIGYECDDNPAELMALICLKASGSEECAFLKENKNSRSSKIINNGFKFCGLLIFLALIIT